jgi:hypothetical protein
MVRTSKSVVLETSMVMPVPEIPASTPGLICYSLAPIDFGWGQIQTVQFVVDLEIQRMLAHDRGLEADFEALSLPEFLQQFEDSRQLAISLGFDGILREEPRVFWMPDGSGDFCCGFVFKQNENGITYVISPVQLPWLDKSCNDRTSQTYLKNHGGIVGVGEAFVSAKASLLEDRVRRNRVADGDLN